MLKMARRLRLTALDKFKATGVVPTGKELGSGAYGSVEEVQIPGGVCAAKRLHENLLKFGSDIQVEKWVTQFVNECELMSSLRHPNIVQFLGICYLPGSKLPVLLLEKLLTCLHTFLEKKPNIPLDGKHSLLVGIISGLAFLHGRSPPIIHRDFTARNILLDASLTPKLTDMGVARMVTIQPGQVAATMTRAPGNVLYMPPEAVGEHAEAVGEDTTKYNSAIDIFSFGNVALFTLTEVFPKDLKPASFFDPKTGRLLGRSEVDRRAHYFYELYKLLDSTHPLVQLIHQCLEYLPENRPTATGVLEQLERSKHQLQVSDWNKTKFELLQEINEERRQSSTQIERLRYSIEAKQKQVDYLSHHLQQKMADNRALTQRLTEQPAVRFNKKLAFSEKAKEIKRLITERILDEETQLQVLKSEFKLRDKESANVLQLLEEFEGKHTGGARVRYPLQHYVEAATCKYGSDIEQARKMLVTRECPICIADYPLVDFVIMPGCIHSICKDCFKANFTIIIKEKGVKYFICPMCEKPDMAKEDTEDGLYIELFKHLIKEYLDEHCYRLCLDKLREFNLSKDPNFVRCTNINCGSGFIGMGCRADKVTCPACSESMCRKCKKPWESAHEGISCFAFAQCKIDNDPDVQEQGLAAFLQANGIECPQCHFKYDLARGGSMHFKCIECPNEFCSGCGQSFKQGQLCGKLESCKGKGLHAHHPRDCLFYMRDFDVEELQAFLIQHFIICIGGTVPKRSYCSVMLQKETMEGLKDMECGRAVVDGHLGRCITHYKEYMVDLINKRKLDPITMYSTYKIEAMLTREQMVLPWWVPGRYDESMYREKLIQGVLQREEERLEQKHHLSEAKSSSQEVKADVQKICEEEYPALKEEIEKLKKKKQDRRRT